LLGLCSFFCFVFFRFVFAFHRQTNPEWDPELYTVGRSRVTTATYEELKHSSAGLYAMIDDRVRVSAADGRGYLTLADNDAPDDPQYDLASADRPRLYDVASSLPNRASANESSDSLGGHVYALSSNPSAQFTGRELKFLSSANEESSAYADPKAELENPSGFSMYDLASHDLSET
jgi:hypothetical protein